MKYFGSTVWGINLPKELHETWGWSDTRRGYRIVVKAKSLAEANRKTEAWFGKKLFNRDFTADTGNPLEIELCDQWEGIICQNDNKHDFHSLVEASEVYKNIKS